MPAPFSPDCFRLMPHPATPGRVIDAIGCSIALTDGGDMQLRYTLEGDCSSLRLPAPAAPLPTDGLWRHTCCELFLAQRDAPTYLEFNFAPSGAWARYAFGAERQREAGATRAFGAPRIRTIYAKDRVVLEATLPASLLAPFSPERDALDLALACVIEEHDGQRAWWALRHPAAQPDFHLRAGFVPLSRTTLAETALTCPSSA